MHWKIKARIQSAVSILPPSIGYPSYYWIQRNFGGLKNVNPASKLIAAIETCKMITDLGKNTSGKVFLEIGTGRAPVVPIAYWLMGAEKTITIDLNPYLKLELIEEHLNYMFMNKQKIQVLFGSLLIKERFDALFQLFVNKVKPSVSEILDLCQIDYIAPGDATNTSLYGQSIDFHTSNLVFEHISPLVLKEILKEGNRVIKNDGLFIHRIDYSDHFSHSDSNISSINFLQYSDTKWSEIAGNKYMYMNRLRHDDFIRLFKSVGHNITDTKIQKDICVQELLKNGHFQLFDRFRSKPVSILEISNAWIITSKNG